MPDHLIGVGNGMMAVSQTFACGVPVPNVPYVLAPNARTVHLIHAHAVAITPNYAGAAGSTILIAFRLSSERGREKKCSAERREPLGSTWCR